MKLHKRGLNIFLLVASLVMLLYSMTFPQHEGDAVAEAVKLEKSIDKRLEKLEKVALSALDSSEESLFKNKDIPSDFVLYRYENSHLTSWHGQLPIQYDEYIGTGRHSTLSSVGETYKFYYFTGTSYLMRRFQEGDVKVIAAMAINNNKYLSLDSDYSLRRITSADGVVVKVQGEPSFRIVYDSLPVKSALPAHAAWIAFLLFVAAVLVALYGHPTLGNANATIILLSFFIVAVYRNYSVLHGELTQILSILIVVLELFIISSSLYIARRDLWKQCKKKVWRVTGTIATLILVGAMLWFAYISIYKVLVYTHINLDLAKLWATDYNTIVVYVTLFVLFFSIAELLDLLQPVWLRLFHRRMSLFSSRGILIYSAFVGLFCIGFTSYIGYQREKIMVASWAESISNGRDYGFEAHLRKIERQISRDELISAAGDSEEQLAKAKERIRDRYMSKFKNVYDVDVVVGKSGSSLNIEDGVQIESGSRFKYAPLYDQRSRYIAAFNYYHGEKGFEVVYIVLEPKYPYKHSLSMLLDPRISGDIPSIYSYAMYKGGERQYLRGSFPYPTKLTAGYRDEFNRKGEFSFRKKGYLNFVVPVDKDEFIVISRAFLSPGTIVIFFVFLSLLFCLIMLPFSHKKRRPLLFEKNYFKRHINIMMVASLLITMSLLAIVSVSFVYDRNMSLYNKMMSDKVNSIRFQLQSGLRSITSAGELNSRDVLDLLWRVGDNTGSDIVLYRVDGKTALSTAPELHERHILGYRMREEPYYQLHYENEGYYIYKERVGKRVIYMLYAPIVGANGDVIAYISSPYMENGRDFQLNALMHAFNVIVVFLILLIISSFSVSYFVDKTFMPLSVMSRTMRSGKLEKLENLGYNNDDEIMDIVNSYNRMVDDLRGNAKVLAQAERDKAWSEMARNVAHEIKNPLTPMQLQIQRVQRLKAAGDPAWQEKFDVMAGVLLDHIHVLTETANQFSDFAKLYSEDPVDVALDDMLREEVALYDNRPGVEFEYLGLPDVVVSAPRPQLIRVFVNLLNNAVQACEDREDGRVAVSLRNGSSPDFYEIVIEDNGPGVSEENIDKLFTPKFTTKSSGSGLGLSICRSILERCGASITYSRSFRLGGACFTILYPKS